VSATRILPPDEWHRIEDEEAIALLETLDPDDVAVVVVEDAGAIVARMTVLRVPWFESFWMAPEKAGNAGVTRALLSAAADQARQWAPCWVFAAADCDATSKTLARLGGRELSVSTFMLPLRRVEMEEVACPPL
jgi:hypothetical protein